jgi:SAM-dependent methyltransferase
MAEYPSLAGSHWKLHAAQWEKVGSPLRPVNEDAALYWSAITSLLAEPDLAAARVLLLGVTPELVSLRWPADSSLFSCDSSPDMLKHIWPLGRFPGAFFGALRADWRALPISSGTFNLIVGDGSLSVLGCADDHRACAREFHRILQPGGGLVLRLFCQPPTPELPEKVLSDLRDGNVGGFHAFKWRLVMAVHASDPDAKLADVWARWKSEFPEPEPVGALSGWPPDAIGTLAAYRDAPARYSFYTLRETCALLSPEFEFIGAAWPNYELGERCPVARFRRRSA